MTPETLIPEDERVPTWSYSDNEPDEGEVWGPALGTTELDWNGLNFGPYPVEDDTNFRTDSHPERVELSHGPFLTIITDNGTLWWDAVFVGGIEVQP